MDIKYIIEQLNLKKDERINKIYSKDNPSLEIIGVKMKDIRALAKGIGINHGLAIKLNDQEIYETMMLSTLIADHHQITNSLITSWVKRAHQSPIIDQGLSHFFLKVKSYDELLKTWCLSNDDDLRYAGFSLLSTYFRLEALTHIKTDFGIDMLSKIEDTIVKQPPRIQNVMNNAVVMAGLHVPDLVDKAYETAKKIGYILPLKAKNSCNIQSALDYLDRYITQPKYSRVAKIRTK